MDNRRPGKWRSKIISIRQIKNYQYYNAKIKLRLYRLQIYDKVVIII